MTKQKKLRHSEYYDLQPVFDRLYAGSQQGKIFTKLMDIISSEENIRLAYRNIKRNGGSNTAGTDKQTIKDIEKLPVEQYVCIVQRKLMYYDRTGGYMAKALVALLSDRYVVSVQPPPSGKDYNDYLCMSLGLPITHRKGKAQER